MTKRFTIALALFCLAMSATITCGDDSECLQEFGSNKNSGRNPPIAI
jgi:hypothetical protein